MRPSSSTSPPSAKSLPGASSVLIYGCSSSITPHVRRMSSRTRSSYTSGVRRMASGTPAAFVSATALAPLMERLVKSVMGRTMGMGIDTRSRGKLSCIQLVGVVLYPPSPVKLSWSTSIELKCSVCTSVPSRMKPFRGAAHPSPMTCSQLTSISVKGTIGIAAASACLAASWSAGTIKLISSPPSGAVRPDAASGAPERNPRLRSSCTSSSTHWSIVFWWFIMWISGVSGTSYGESMPVKFLILPSATFLYSPLGSRALTTSRGTSMKTSTNGIPLRTWAARAASRSLR
mmetsp:Transcript_18879/g.38411  ORF Transcript_18879/g.38411 Transcript_18879/m.38411 type:complete len:289 (+) Transcript_18879:1946-2812(+)